MDFYFDKSACACALQQGNSTVATELAISLWFVKTKQKKLTKDQNQIFELLNTQYLRNPDFIYVLKMEYVHKINIFGLKMMAKSGLEKNIFEIPPCAKPFSENLFYFIERWISGKIANSVIEITSFAHGEISIYIFLSSMYIW